MSSTLLLLLLVAVLLCSAEAHGGHKEASSECKGAAASMALLQADYVPGTITVDGATSDWDSVEGHQFSLYPALNPAGDPFPGKMTIKVAHDGRDLFFLLQVPASYQYKQGDKHRSASIALMFPVGDDATYVDMGGCPEDSNCTREACGGHEVDIMHFSVANAIPGRTYGSNLLDNTNATGRESADALHDTYAYNPHCRHYDGIGPEGLLIGSGAQNDWNGVWTHTSITNKYGFTAFDSPYGSPSSPGTYVFELSRPLRTGDRLQQDAQFTIGNSYNLAAAFWYPLNDQPWSPMQHYSANCDWIPMSIRAAAAGNARYEGGLATTFSLFFGVGSLIASAAIVWWLKSSKQQVTFTQLGSSNL